MSHSYEFDDAGRIPMPGDNVAIAIKRLEAGSRIGYRGTQLTLNHTILEGHRFAIMPIDAGQPLLSWGLPFGIAIRDLSAGDYACNASILETLRSRSIDFELPSAANFRDVLDPYTLDEKSIHPGVQVPLHAETRTFAGYWRSAARGVGTRNDIVILGTSSRTASYAKALEERLRGVAGRYDHVDGIVAVAHTEGGGVGQPNNREFLLRTLSGFMIHPNVGAVLAVDHGDEAVTNQHLRRYMEEHGYAPAEVPHHFLTLDAGFEDGLDRGASIVEGLLEQVSRTRRTQQSLAYLKVALQCGGSDAFSGISGNPLAAWVAKEIIRYGGAANLAETDELIGAEPYVLRNVRDVETARAFLRMVEEFKERLRWHGHTAEGNPSGGNKYRGLYNIAIKSIGAAMKRHPDVRLDYVVDYSERMDRPGYYFMNSPGNDLESIAGQVASGCNLIFFVTGNGSITNFPFVPTIKIVTTTGRYTMLSREMDVNAGAYLDGVPMDELGRRMLELTIDAASGQLTAGERAAHAQVSIWRNWMQTDASKLERLQQRPVPSGRPLVEAGRRSHPGRTFNAIRTARGNASDQIGLIMPTSLCAGQIAKRIADYLNTRGVGRDRLSRFVALPHTEGCGSSAGSSEEMYVRAVLGYLTHPIVGLGLLLEHGCEKTHNDYFRHGLARAGIDPDRFGWASIQLDGGIDNVVQKVEDWFTAQVAEMEPRIYQEADLECLRLGLSSVGPLPPGSARSLARLTDAIVGAGGTVIVPQTATLLSVPAYVDTVVGTRDLENSLAYGQAATIPGFHVMEAPTDHWVESVTGLAATGVDAVLVYTTGRPLQGHRMIPVIQVTTDAQTWERYGADMDLALPADEAEAHTHMLDMIVRVASRSYTPRLFTQGNTDVQFTRGLLGVSM